MYDDMPDTSRSDRISADWIMHHTLPERRESKREREGGGERARARDREQSSSNA